jgi:rare lipoprotein A
MERGTGLLLLALPLLFSCAAFSKKSGDSAKGIKEHPIGENSQIGVASWYGIDEHGLPTATGERFSKNTLTAAHKTLPMGTMVRVTNLENGRDVIVKINDRGPFIEGRMIDLSYAAAKSIGLIRNGTANVKVEVISAPGRSSNFFDPKYTIQVASFSDKNNALMFKDELAHRIDEEVRVETFYIEGKYYYRVRIGHYEQRATAEELSLKLRNHGFTGKVILE